jgi:hypothetical protein
MPDPISNQVFSHDYEKYVYQDPDVRIIHQIAPAKPFELNPPEKPKKNKKDFEKNKQQDSGEKKKKSIFEQ